MIKTRKSAFFKTGLSVSWNFSISQHASPIPYGTGRSDTELLKSFIEYLGCGNYYSASGGTDSGCFVVSNFSDITSKVILFFDTYPLQGAKSLDYANFKEAAKIIETKAHLTEKGLAQIIIIKNGMNRKRIY